MMLSVPLHKIVRRYRLAAGTTALCLLLIGCEAGQPGTGAAKNGSLVGRGAVAPLTDAEFNALTLDQRYHVMNKLMATFYKGLPVSEFYDLGAGLANATPLDPSLTPSRIRQQLTTALADDVVARIDSEIVGNPEARDETGALAPIEARYQFDDKRPKQMPLARIHEYPLSQNLLSQWMAWHLANTILFSPAEEMESADITDVQNLFRRLDLSMMEQQSIRAIVGRHQRTVENWRRFRSPEDNTREMMEIYLGLFDNDEEVPRASQACRDLYLTDERGGYKLARTDFPNIEPQLVLGTYVLDCDAFYDTVAAHPLLIPRVVSVLVDYFHAGKTTERRLAITQGIVQTNPRTFSDVFLTMMFSRDYLLDTTRPKSFEETFLSTAERLEWEADPDVFRGITNGRGRLARTEMKEMGWSSMSLKLGRVNSVPLDSLSFANYHKAVRESLLLNYWTWRTALGLEPPKAPSPRPIPDLADNATARQIAEHAVDVANYEQELAALSTEDRAAYDEALVEYRERLERHEPMADLTTREFVDYLFLTVVSRRAADKEFTGISALFDSEGYFDDEFGQDFLEPIRLDDAALIVLDYLSRLPETYYLTSTTN